MKARLNAGHTPELYFFRDQRGLEIDPIVHRGRRLLPIEIKGGMTYDPWSARNLKTFLKLTDAAESPTIIHAGEQSAFSEGIQYAHFSETTRIVTDFDA
jgi:predicted AAA+ superfamily ATPase